MINVVITSPLKNKKYRVIMSVGFKIYFGLKGSSTYLDHKDETKRNNYRVRHLENDKEKSLIKSLIPSPALFSYYLLWGPNSSLEHNIKYLYQLLK